MRQEIAAIEAGYRIGRLLVLRETLGQAPSQFSAATKTFCTELEQRIAGFCVRVLGPQALLAEPGLAHRVSRNICYALGYTIMGGTSQILRNILGERTLGLPREAPARLSRRLRRRRRSGGRGAGRVLVPVALQAADRRPRVAVDRRRPQPGIDHHRALATR